MTRSISTGCATTGVPARAGDGVAKGDTSKKKIAFSNSYAGNSFRQVMIKSFLDMGAQAKKDQLIGDVSGNGKGCGRCLPAPGREAKNDLRLRLST